MDDAEPTTRGYGPTWDQITLHEWLELLDAPDEDRPMVTFAFPNERVRAEYLSSMPSRTGQEVRDLLRHFLARTGELGIDEVRVEWLKHLSQAGFDHRLRQPQPGSRWGSSPVEALRK